MSETCPKCGADEVERGASPRKNLACLTSIWDTPYPPEGTPNGTIDQSDKCRIAELEAENARLLAELHQLIKSWNLRSQRPGCTDRMRKRALRECRDELIKIVDERRKQQ